MRVRRPLTICIWHNFRFYDRGNIKNNCGRLTAKSKKIVILVLTNKNSKTQNCTPDTRSGPLLGCFNFSSSSIRIIFKDFGPEFGFFKIIFLQGSRSDFASKKRLSISRRCVTMRLFENVIL